MRLTNMTTRPVSLSNGTMLAAAGTEGSSKEVKELSERDRKRLVPATVRVEEPATTAVEAKRVAEPIGNASKEKK
jgi:hypothetical protein